jgi:hypothetical protein
MRPRHFVPGSIYTVALALLPAVMDSPAARAMLTAIALQESRFTHRRQINGPARGWWQFEPAGVRGVLHHGASRPHLAPVLAALGYPPEVTTIYTALEHNDVLACCVARLLLWTHPRPLPLLSEPQYAWDYYLELWRPGRPHRHTWDAFYAEAWQ